MLDVVANKLASTLNEANQLPDETIYESILVESIDQDGNIVKTLEFVDEDGNVVTGDKSRYQLKPEYSDYNGGILLSNHSNSNDNTGITAANISISRNWANGSFRVLRSTEPNPPSTAKDNLTHMCNVLTGNHEFYANTEDVYEKAANGEVFFTGSFQSLLTDHMVAQLASDQRNVNVMYDNRTASADEVYVNRDGVMGVDLNDEAMNLMMYQRSYAAACRLMTSFDEMIDRLVNGMAV
jgi:flagellar hook-associated protein 1 FlgK